MSEPRDLPTPFWNALHEWRQAHLDWEERSPDREAARKVEWAGNRVREEFASAIKATAGGQPPSDGMPSEMEKLCAMLLCETGRVPDPRFADVRAVDVREVVRRKPSKFKWKSSPLTDQQVRDVLRAYAAERGVSAVPPTEEPNE